MAADTKAMITGSSFSSGSELGFRFVQSGASTYDGKTYNNIKLTYSGSSWSPASAVLLSSTQGIIHSYYPYSSSVTNLAAIPVTASSSVQTDYMYGSAVSGLCMTKTTASITMNHALSAVNVKLVKGTYTGAGTVTSVSIKGDGISTGATLDATSGTLSSFTGTGTAISQTVSYNMSASGTSNNIMVVPNGVSKTITISVVVDGVTFTATSAAVALSKGKIHEYVVTLDSSGLSIQSVSIQTWSTVSQGSLSLLL